MKNSIVFICSFSSTVNVAHNNCYLNKLHHPSAEWSQFIKTSSSRKLCFVHSVFKWPSVLHNGSGGRGIHRINQNAFALLIVTILCSAALALFVSQLQLFSNCSRQSPSSGVRVFQPFVTKLRAVMKTFTEHNRENWARPKKRTFNWIGTMVSPIKGNWAIVERDGWILLLILAIIWKLIREWYFLTI